MSGFAIKMTFDDAAVDERFSGMVRRIENLDPALKDIGEYMIREREKLFVEERDPDGNPWQPVKIRTLYGSAKGKRYTKKGALTKRFVRHLAGKKILTRDHHLRRTVYRIEGRAVVIAPDKISDDYAAIHQKGGQAGRNHAATIPARPHLGFSDENRREIRQILTEHVL